MKHRFVAVLAALAMAVTALVAVGASPALANHANNPSSVYPTGYHWGNGYSPFVQCDFVNWDCSGPVLDAAYFWQDNGFRQGYQPPVPSSASYSCGSRDGGINLCRSDRGSSLFQYNSGLDGLTYVTAICDDPNGNCSNRPLHVLNAVSVVASDLTGLRRQEVIRHEFGHALGLGHSFDSTSVMRIDAPTPYADQHDDDAMYSMYTAHVYG